MVRVARRLSFCGEREVLYSASRRSMLGGLGEELRAQFLHFLLSL